MKVRRAGTSHGRGVSDVVAFVLSLALILGSVAFVYAAGFGAVDDVYDAQRIDSAETGMSVLSTHVTELTNHHAPSRKLALNLRGGTVRYTTRGWNVTTDGRTLNSGSMQFGIGQATIRSEAGGLFTVWPDGSVVRESPSLSCSPTTDGRIALTVVEFVGENVSVSGDGTVVLELDRQSTSRYRGNVTLEPEPVEPWADTLESMGWNRSGDQFSCTGESVFLRVVRIRIGVES